MPRTATTEPGIESSRMKMLSSPRAALTIDDRLAGSDCATQVRRKNWLLYLLEGDE